MYKNICNDFERLKNSQKAKALQRFFKTGKGEYGEGDVFLGITVPEQRKLVLKYRDLDLNDLQRLLDSKIHEHRLTALLILVEKHKRAKDEEKREIVDFYLKNTRNINNWDLVDLSSPHILGEYLLHRNRSILYKLAVSDNLWERRIAILATFWFIRDDDFGDAINIAEKLLTDKQDLIHKALGWMLREAGKRDEKVLEKFLDKHAGRMSRTCLRYAIEKMSEAKRKYYLERPTL